MSTEHGHMPTCMLQWLTLHLQRAWAVKLKVSRSCSTGVLHMPQTRWRVNLEVQYFDTPKWSPAKSVWKTWICKILYQSASTYFKEIFRNFGLRVCATATQPNLRVLLADAILCFGSRRQWQQALIVPILMDSEDCNTVVSWMRGYVISAWTNMILSKKCEQKVQRTRTPQDCSSLAQLHMSSVWDQNKVSGAVNLPRECMIWV